MKESGVGQGVSVNGLLSGGITGTINFTAYISPYLVLNNGGYYTKHIYMGSQRIVSKLNSSEIFLDTVPTAKKKAYNMDFTSKFADLTSKIKVRYDSLGVVYKMYSKPSILLPKLPFRGRGSITSTAIIWVVLRSLPIFRETWRNILNISLLEKYLLMNAQAQVPGVPRINSTPRNWTKKRGCTITGRDIMIRDRVCG